MRPPRFRFSEEVRSATRAMATRSVQGGTVAHTPEELDAWIAGAPDVHETMVRGGYGTEFTAEDVFPLYEVFVGQAGGSVAPAAAAPAARTRWPAARIAVGVVIAATLAALVAFMG